MLSGARVKRGPVKSWPNADLMNSTPPNISARVLLRPPAASSGMRIGLLGGSFNPAHEGHLHISRMALIRLNLHQLWWLVTPGNPLKDRRGLRPLGERMAQAQAMARHPRIRVTGFEAARPDSYTINTLRFLKQRYRDTRFVWLMGADNMVQFHHWREWRQIFSAAPIAVLDRPGYRFAASASRAAQSFACFRIEESDARGLAQLPVPAWSFLSLPLSNLSSTLIRGRFGENPEQTGDKQGTSE